MRPGVAQATLLIRARKGIERLLGRARGTWLVCDDLPLATRPPRRGPSIWGTIPTKRRHQRGIATAGPPSAVVSQSRAMSSRRRSCEATPGAVVCAIHCWGTRATRHHARSTIFARRASRLAPGGGHQVPPSSQSRRGHHKWPVPTAAGAVTCGGVLSA